MSKATQDKDSESVMAPIWVKVPVVLLAGLIGVFAVLTVLDFAAKSF
jgi:hypothetical protein